MPVHVRRHDRRRPTGSPPSSTTTGRRSTSSGGPPLPEDEAIAALVAELIPDGATIQFGVGGTPDAVLARLHDKRDLGVHSGLISDAFVDLVEAGVVTNARKEIDTGVTVTGALFGTDRLYGWADRNPALSMRSLDYTHDAARPRRARLAARDQLGGRGRPHRPDQRRVGGRPLRRHGRRAGRVRPRRDHVGVRPIDRRPAVHGARRHDLADRRTASPTASSSTARADADLIVTEHGVADLRGASLAERGPPARHRRPPPLATLERARSRPD